MPGSAVVTGPRLALRCFARLRTTHEGKQQMFVFATDATSSLACPSQTGTAAYQGVPPEKRKVAGSIPTATAMEIKPR
jgi:hypothetical protein